MSKRNTLWSNQRYLTEINRYRHFSQVLHDCLSPHRIYTYGCYLNSVRYVWECYQRKLFKHSWRQHNPTNVREGKKKSFFNQAISQRSLVINFKAKITVTVLRSRPRQHLYTGILTVRMPPAHSTSNAHGVNSSLLPEELKTSLFLLNLTAVFNTVGHMWFLTPARSHDISYKLAQIILPKDSKVPMCSYLSSPRNFSCIVRTGLWYDQ